MTKGRGGHLSSLTNTRLCRDSMCPGLRKREASGTRRPRRRSTIAPARTRAPREARPRLRPRRATRRLSSRLSRPPGLCRHQEGWPRWRTTGSEPIWARVGARGSQDARRLAQLSIARRARRPRSTSGTPARVARGVPVTWARRLTTGGWGRSNGGAPANRGRAGRTRRRMTDPGDGTARPGPAAAGIALAVLSAGTFGASGIFGSALISSGWSPAAAAIARLGGAAVLLTVPAVVQLRGRLALLGREGAKS